MSLDRSLGFASTVRREFQFLETSYGFTNVAESETLVEYESDKVAVRVYHGRSSFEIGIEVSLKSAERDIRYRLPSILAALGVAYERKNLNWQASSPDGVRRGVAFMAEIIKRYCGPVLQGDLTTFRSIDSVELANQEEVTSFYTFAPIREQADQAWKNRDYARVVELYSQILPVIEPSERRRLEFAQNKVQNDE